MDFLVPKFILHGAIRANATNLSLFLTRKWYGPALRWAPPLEKVIRRLELPLFAVVLRFLPSYSDNLRARHRILLARDMASIGLSQRQEAGDSLWVAKAAMSIPLARPQ